MGADIVSRLVTDLRHTPPPSPAAAADGASELTDWLARRSYRAEDFPLALLLERKRASVSVVLPAREVASTIAPILEALLPLQDAGLVDELLVIDAASADGTAEIARALGVRVVQEAEVLPRHGPCRGKGDALWRALSVTAGEVVAFLDSDTDGFEARFLLGLLGPLLAGGNDCTGGEDRKGGEDRNGGGDRNGGDRPGGNDPAVGNDPTGGEDRDAVQFVKGAYRRPFRLGDQTIPDGGGRVTELVARPLLNLHLPALAGFVQPLAGEFAGRRALLEALPFPVGYGVEIATLIDALRHAGLDALAQVDLGTRQNAHQPLRALSAMAYAVMAAAERRIHGEEGAAIPGPLALPHGGGLELVPVAVEERPPLRTLRP